MSEGSSELVFYGDADFDSLDIGCYNYAMSDFDNLARHLGVTSEELRNMITEKKPLSVSSVQAAELLGISREHVSRLCRSGKLTARKRGGQTSPWHIDLSSVIHFSKEQSSNVS